MLDRNQARKLVFDTLRDELRIEPLLEITEADELDLLPGADSVRLMRAVAELETQLEMQFDDERIREATTIGDIVDFVVGGEPTR